MWKGVMEYRSAKNIEEKSLGRDSSLTFAIYHSDNSTLFLFFQGLVSVVALSF